MSLKRENMNREQKADADRRAADFAEKAAKAEGTAAAGDMARFTAECAERSQQIANGTREE